VLSKNIIDLIDHALAEHGDAMRWAPDDKAVHEMGHVALEQAEMTPTLAAVMLLLAQVGWHRDFVQDFAAWRVQERVRLQLSLADLGYQLPGSIRD
jgi:hypothetical protein